MTQHYETGFKNGVIAFANYLKKHFCSYDLDNYHSFDAIDIDDLDDSVEEFLDKSVIDSVLTKEQIHIVLRDFVTLVSKEEPSQARYEKICLLQDLDRAFREA